MGDLLCKSFVLFQDRSFLLRAGKDCPEKLQDLMESFKNKRLEIVCLLKDDHWRFDASNQSLAAEYLATLKVEPKLSCMNPKDIYVEMISYLKGFAFSLSSYVLWQIMPDGYRFGVDRQGLISWKKNEVLLPIDYWRAGKEALSLINHYHPTFFSVLHWYLENGQSFELIEEPEEESNLEEPAVSEDSSKYRKLVA